MNRKQKIIVSITGITVVMLALLGLTYGYYLTNIYGNTNSNSISVTTSDLKLTYRDGTGELIASGVMPGDEITNKTFTVENDGTNDIEAYTVALINIMNNFTFKDDLEVSISCFSNINNGKCNGFAEEYENNIYKEKYPAVNSELFSLGIKKDEIHTYTLTVDYLYQEFDQSDDMGKTLKGKVQIFDPKGTIEVTGEVTGASEGDYAEIHSDVQTSEIIDGVYKFIGIPADNHTLYIKNRETGSEKSTTLEIKKGQSEGISNNSVTIIDSSKSVEVDINASNTTLSTTINKITGSSSYDPFKAATNTLAYNIVTNAKNNANGTKLVDTPPTKVAEEPSTDNWSEGVEEKVYLDSSLNLQAYFDSDENAVMCYELRYICEENPDYCLENGFDYITMCGEEPFTYITSDTQCSDYKGKYVMESDWYYTYFVEDCIDGSPVIGTAKYEKVLSKALDDYGTSYYFRGMPSDNYVNFSGKCWRIVRIQGDGSVKLILEDTSVCSKKMDRDFEISTANYGYVTITNVNGDSSYKADYVNSTNGMRSALETWINNESNGIDLTKLKNEEWCIGNTIDVYNNSSPYDKLNVTRDNLIFNNQMFMYKSIRRLLGKGTKKTATLKCDGEIYSSKIGALTADEVVFAGNVISGAPKIPYYLHNYRHSWLTLTVAEFSDAFSEDAIVVVYADTGSVCGATRSDTSIPRPAVILKAGITISSGNGTITNPYVIN